jgi:mono/diheme cytochrome c family protein
VVTKDGATVSGRLLNIDSFTVQMIDTREQLRSFTKTNLKEFGFIPSPMPSFKSTFNTQELADVVSYLVSLKGRPTP